MRLFSIPASIKAFLILKENKMRIFRADEKIYDFPKPQLTLVNKLNILEGQTLILCAGFEARSQHVAKLLSEVNIKKMHVILINYLPEIGENKFVNIKKLCEDRNYNLTELIYDRHKPAGFADVLTTKIKNGTNQIWLDISGMARLLIVQIISCFSQNNNFLKKTVLLYCEAEKYPPTKEEADRNLIRCEESPFIDFSFLSSGINDVAVLPELATVSVGDCPNYLIAFPSFNPSQLASVIENSPPSKITLIHGMPPSPELRWRPESIKKMNRMAEGPDIDEKFLSTLHYQETLNYLIKIYAENAPFYNLVLSPTGSKMQTVAVGLLRGFFKDIQILFPTHKEFTDPDSYTTGVKSLYELDLGSFVLLRNDLHKDYQGF